MHIIILMPYNSAMLRGPADAPVSKPEHRYPLVTWDTCAGIFDIARKPVIGELRAYDGEKHIAKSDLLYKNACM